MANMRDKKDKEEEYEVEKVVGSWKNKKGKGMEYLLQWKGYLELYDSWVPEKNMENAQELMREFWAGTG